MQTSRVGKRLIGPAPLAPIHPSAQESHSRKYGVAISVGGVAETAAITQVFRTTGSTSANLATNSARKRGKRSSLAIDSRES